MEEEEKRRQYAREDRERRKAAGYRVNPHPHHSPTPESLAARVALAAAAPTGMAVVTAAEIVDMVDRGVVDEAAEVVIDAVEEAGELIGSPVGDVVEDLTEEVEAVVSNPQYEVYNYKTGEKAGVSFDNRYDAEMWIARRKAESPGLRMYWKTRMVRGENFNARALFTGTRKPWSRRNPEPVGLQGLVMEPS